MTCMLSTCSLSIPFTQHVCVCLSFRKSPRQLHWLWNHCESFSTNWNGAKLDTTKSIAGCYLKTEKENGNIQNSLTHLSIAFHFGRWLCVCFVLFWFGSFISIKLNFFNSNSDFSCTFLCKFTCDVYILLRMFYESLMLNEKYERFAFCSYKNT